MPSHEEIGELRSTVDGVLNRPSRYGIYASLVTGRDSGDYCRLYFAYSNGSIVQGYCAPENSESLVNEFSSFDAEIVEKEGRVKFQGNKFLGPPGVFAVRANFGDAEGYQQAPFVADHGYQKLAGDIRSTFHNLSMIFHIVRNVQKNHYPTLLWLVCHGVKVFHEFLGFDQSEFAETLIEEYVLPAVPPNY